MTETEQTALNLEAAHGGAENALRALIVACRKYYGKVSAGYVREPPMADPLKPPKTPPDAVLIPGESPHG